MHTRPNAASVAPPGGWVKCAPLEVQIREQNLEEAAKLAAKEAAKLAAKEAEAALTRVANEPHQQVNRGPGESSRCGLSIIKPHPVVGVNVAKPHSANKISKKPKVSKK